MLLATIRLPFSSAAPRRVSNRACCLLMILSSRKRDDLFFAGTRLQKCDPKSVNANGKPVADEGIYFLQSIQDCRVALNSRQRRRELKNGRFWNVFSHTSDPCHECDWSCVSPVHCVPVGMFCSRRAARKPRRRELLRKKD